MLVNSCFYETHVPNVMHHLPCVYIINVTVEDENHKLHGKTMKFQIEANEKYDNLVIKIAKQMKCDYHALVLDPKPKNLGKWPFLVKNMDCHEFVLSIKLSSALW